MAGGTDGLRRALLGLAILAFVIGIGATALVLGSEHESSRGVAAALGLLVGWGFTGTGLYAWYRRPGNNIGPLMTAVGFTWFLNALEFSGDSVVYSVGVVTGSVTFALLTHLLLSFPTGRLESRLRRLLVAVAYFVTTVAQLAWYLFTDPVADGCDGCPSNPILISQGSDLAGVIDAGQVLIAIALLATVVVMLYRRWRESLPAQRRVFAPVIVTGGLTVSVLLLQLTIDQARLSDSLVDTLDYVGLGVLACVPFAFLLGLLRSRFGRAEAVSSLLSRLGAGKGRSALREALADALGDPTLELAYWVPDQQTFVDAEGHPVQVERVGGGKIATVVEHEGGTVAAIIHDADLDNERDLVRAVGAAAALTLENERLDAELRAHVEELRASRTRIVEAGYAERRRVERDLHDGTQQRLMALGINLRLARSKFESDPRAATELLDGALAELSTATDELREFARGIHPAVLTDRGLDAAVSGLAGRSPIPVDVVETPAERLPAPVESAAYFVVAEALTNVARYANADSARVRVARRNGRVEIEVLDDGIGGANPAQGSGLSGLSDRVAALGGRLEVNSPPGDGTRVTARIPCA